MDKIIVERCNGELIVIDGKGYPREVVENWSSGELTKLRDRLILKCQKEYDDRKCSIYNDFQLYISKAVAKETQMNNERNLAQTIRQMPREDVVAVFTAYFNELLSKTKGDDSKNE